MSEQQISQAVQLLKNQDVVGIPTETVYGLAAAIDAPKGIQKIFSMKERPFFDPLIVHVASLEQAKACTTDWNPLAESLAQGFWPGPLTLILPKSDLISDVITSGLPNVGLRWPRNEIAEEIIRQVGSPLAAPSANKFGRTSPTKASHVRQEFGDQVFVVDGEDSQIGIESTVLSIKHLGGRYTLSILRKGAVLTSQIDRVLFKHSFDYRWSDLVDKKESPGHMKHHYMPSIPFVVCRNPSRKLSEISDILNSKLKELPDRVEGVQIIKPKQKINKIEFLRLSADPAQAAREVYSQLRAASLRNPDALCFIQMPSHTGEMWESIFDRLYKAASLIVD